MFYHYLMDGNRSCNLSICMVIVTQFENETNYVDWNGSVRGYLNQRLLITLYLQMNL